MRNTLPIGIFDSGIGGLTVYKQLQNVLPNENIIYFGDTGRAPYGPRSKEEISFFADQIMRFMSLMSVKVGVVACNTITVVGTEMLSKNYNFDLIGNSFGAKTALEVTKNNRIGIIATIGTINSRRHELCLQELNSEVKVFSKACPQFASMIESGIVSGKEIKGVAKEYLEPLIAEEIDTLILACTHYPYIKDLLQEIVGPNVTIVDPALETAIDVKNYLSKHNALNDKCSFESKMFFSANVEQAKNMAEYLIDTKKCKFDILDLMPLHRYCNI